LIASQPRSTGGNTLGRRRGLKQIRISRRYAAHRR